MSSNTKASPEILKEEVHRLVQRMLAEPTTPEEKRRVEAKLADVSLTLNDVRAGKAVVVPMGWDEDQQALWAMLKEYHRV